MYTIDSSSLEEACYDAGLSFDDAIRTDYSGRGMYGDSCLAIIHDTVGELLQFVIYLRNYDPESVDAWIGSARQDNMGLGVVTYWPRVQVAD